jgi:phosphatidate cytidylyltransferase
MNTIDAMLGRLHPNILIGLAGVFALLVTASLVVWLLGRLKPGINLGSVPARVRSWWVMVLVMSVAVLLSRTVALAFFTLVSFLALKEYLSLIPTRRADRSVLFFAYLSIPLQYVWIYHEWYGMFIIWVPVYLFLFLPMQMVVIGKTEGFLRAAGTLHWGLMMTLFSISHVAYLLVLPAQGNPQGGGAALVFYLVFLTQFNDVAQFLWGKAIGRAKAVPTVSPGKTMGGLLGGLGTTIVLAVVLARHFTPFDLRWALCAGVIIGLGGFIGDVVISALKRDLGVKDSGDLIPGHGGILDRIDSLTYTAPLFFHFVYYRYF